MQFNNPDAPATKKQLWLLHILTKEDTRGLKLTIKEASDRITELKGNGHKSGNGNDYLAILKLADQAASKAYTDYCDNNYKKPRYAVVQRSNPLNASSPGTKTWPMQDLCGVVWLDLKLKGNEKFINWFKKTGKRDNSYSRKHWVLNNFSLGYTSSCSVWSYPWTLNLPGIGSGNGAVSAAEESARAAIEVLDKHGIDVHMHSMLD